MAYEIGQEAILYWGNAGSTASTVLGIVRSHTYDLESAAVEGDYRDSEWTNTRGGQLKLGGQITMRRKTTDTGYQAFKTAIKNRTTIALKMIPVSGNADDVYDGDAAILKVSFSEEMNGYQEAVVTWATNINTREPTIT